MIKANYYSGLDGQKVRCELCHHHCLIDHGNTGICRTRLNKKGVLYSLVYGYPIVQNIDPVEKKPLYHFLPASQTYSIGTLGCNLSCANCQNYDISQLKDINRKLHGSDEVSPERIIDNALGDDCRSISYTYNEPTVFAEYALAIMKLAHENGLKNIWVSNGYMSSACLNDILPYLDAANIDIKSFDDEFYRNNCGASLAPILENLKRLKEEQVHVEITTLLIPSLSDEPEMLRQLADFIVSDLDADTPWHLTRFAPEISWQLKDHQTTGEDLIYEAVEIGKDAGLKYVYAGNLPGDQYENTYCPKCREVAIRRFGYHIERFDLNGHCSYCDRSLDIID